jgi:hypothetical protein
MKHFTDTIGTRTRDFPDCSTVPQPTAPPRASFSVWYELKFYRVRQQNMPILRPLFWYIGLNVGNTKIAECQQ